MTHLSTDSRTLRPGDLFVALRGDNFDGHKFIGQAARARRSRRGRGGNWTGKPAPDFSLLRVADTLAAYQQIAGEYRRSLGLKVVAITGSNGKTSTKDFTAAVLSRRFRVTKTEGNFNNHIGLPLTMLRASAEDEVAVWEIGMNHPGEIAPLAKLARPGRRDHHQHRHRPHRIHGHARSDRAGEGRSRGIVRAERDCDSEQRRRIRGSDRAAHHGQGASSPGSSTARCARMRSRRLRVAPSSAFSKARIAVTPILPVPGLHMVQNALLAVAAGRALGVSLEECAAGLATAPLTQARLQIKTIRGVQFIDDSYNANPDSMKAALRTLMELETEGERIAVLGQMAELGAESAAGHREVGEAAASLGIDRLDRARRRRARDRGCRAGRRPNEKHRRRHRRGSG